MAEFLVGTFYNDRRSLEAQRKAKPRLSDVSGYLRYYNPEWDGCIEYKINASTGAQAKRLAREARLVLETHREETRDG